MDYSGPDTLRDLEDDLALSDEDDVIPEGDYPPLPQTSIISAGLPSPVAPHLVTHPKVPNKRVINHSSDSGSEPTSPAAKASKRRELLSSPPPASTEDIGTLSIPQPHHTPLETSVLKPTSLAFAPRAEYFKLQFKDNPNVDIKLRWLSEVNQAFHLDRFQAEVKMAAITSRFVYISRRRTDIVDSVTRGEFLSLFLEVQDSPERPRKYPTYLLTRYPVCMDPSLAKELPGVHTARRFHQNGEPLSRLVITWSFPSPPPPSVTFSFLPCLPACELRRMADEQPSCYRCWGTGHISRYGSGTERCAWCSGQHDSHTCHHRIPPSSPPADTASASTSNQPDPPAPDTSQWKCPRCHQVGVNAWHGCFRPQRAPHAAPSAERETARPPSHGASSTHSTGSESAQVASLRDAVASLKSKVASFSARFDAMEARIESMVTKQVETETI